MNSRYYPLQLADFKREIEPHIISSKNTVRQTVKGESL